MKPTIELNLGSGTDIEVRQDGKRLGRLIIKKSGLYWLKGKARKKAKRLTHAQFPVVMDQYGSDVEMK